VQNPDWEKHCASQKEAPHTFCETSEDVVQPRENTDNADYCVHGCAPLDCFCCEGGTHPNLRHVACTSAWRFHLKSGWLTGMLGSVFFMFCPFCPVWNFDRGRMLTLKINR
jgi:hypothetical protein